MTPYRSLTGTLTRLPVLRNPWLRRGLFVVLLAICAALTLFPQKYRAAVSLTPTDPGTLGLSGTLGQLGAVNSVFGNQAAIEVSQKVAHSEYVRSIVAKQTNLEQRLQLSPIEVHRWLERHVDITVLRGGIMQIELKQRDAEFARRVVSAYGEAVRSQLALIARRQTEQKRAILQQLFERAGDRLSKARTAYDTFRLSTRYSSPQAAFYAAGDRIPALEADIRAKEVDLNAMRQFATDDNIRVRQMIAAIDALRQQLAVAKSTSPQQDSSVGQVVRQTTEAERLSRELDIAQSLYENYKRFLQGTSVEDLTSGVTIRILEPAYIDSERQLNFGPLALGVLILLLALALEFYPLRPPLSETRLAEKEA
ncbi:hypothetical protein HNP52_002795 [Sphingomonas kyeonggiensis]|uniref:Capsule biosynthesis protein n=1 Tax=Sphingomonas kyeonggiensis TaxID=1268553 RepID=A0A7W7K294_9SPHN|nr:hypothetical protein [Sphingomonas kyeonggiensis]MBB4839726.1 hypothetical protein [Sphingomonas kyeonggiensis]